MKKKWELQKKKVLFTKQYLNKLVAVERLVFFLLQLMAIGLHSEVGVLGHHVMSHAVVEQNLEAKIGHVQIQNQNMADNRVMEVQPRQLQSCAIPWHVQVIRIISFI